MPLNTYLKFNIGRKLILHLLIIKKLKNFLNVIYININLIFLTKRQNINGDYGYTNGDCGYTNDDYGYYDENILRFRILARTSS
jgi:hypothetical protein